MTPLRRRLATIGTVALALLVVSCGVEAGDAATSSGRSSASTTVPSDRTPQEQAAIDTVAKTYRDLGFTDEEASCLAEGIAGVMTNTTDEPAGMTDIMDIINECDIPISRFSEIQGNMGSGSTDDALKSSMATGFKNLGMTDEQADCVADSYIDEYGLDIEAMQDPTKLEPFLDTCGVDPSELTPGG